MPLHIICSPHCDANSQKTKLSSLHLRPSPSRSIQHFCVSGASGDCILWGRVPSFLCEITSILSIRQCQGVPWGASPPYTWVPASWAPQCHLYLHWPSLEGTRGASPPQTEDAVWFGIPKMNSRSCRTNREVQTILAHSAVFSSITFCDDLLCFFFRFCRWVFGLSLVKFLSSYYAIMYDVNAFSKKRESRKNLSLFFVQKIFFSILELNIFLVRRESENIWRKYENIKLLVCLFWQLFTITFRPRVFEFFAEVSVGCWGNIWRWNIWFFFLYIEHVS